MTAQTLMGPDDWPSGLILCLLDASRGGMAGQPSFLQVTSEEGHLVVLAVTLWC